MKAIKKQLSILLATLMLISMFSVAAFAANYSLVEIPTATLNAGERLTLATRTMTGAKVIDTDTGDVVTDSIRYTWKNPGASTKIEESQYCQAQLSVNGVSLGVVYIYVRINGDESPQPPYPSDKKETEFLENPTVGDYAYDGVTTYGDIVLNGGVVVEKGTTNVVAGTMAITGPDPTGTIRSGTRQVQVTFTPNDTEAYSTCITRFDLEVAKGTPAWVGETPVIEVPYGAEKSGRLQIDNSLLNAYVPSEPNVWLFPVYDSEHNFLGDKLFFEFGTHEYLVRPNTLLTTQCTEWNKDVYLPVIVVVKPIEAAFKGITYNSKARTITGTISEPESNYGSGKLNGTVDLTLAEEVISDIPVTNGKFSLNWAPQDTTANVTVPVTAVYNGLEGEFAVVNEAYTGEILFEAHRTITLKSDKIDVEIGNTGYDADTYLTAGQEVEISARLGDWVQWVITDTEGNPVELETTWNSTDSDWFKFIMPEYDLVFDAVFQYQLDEQERLEAEQEKIDNCKCLCHSDSKFVQFFWMLINKFIKLLNMFGVEVLCDCGYPHCTNSVL